MEFNDNDIIFKDVGEEGLTISTGPIGREGIYYKKDGELIRSSLGFVVRAIDIDWGKCKVGTNSYLRTSGDLINWIKNNSGSPNIRYTDKYTNGKEIGVLLIGGTTITLHAPDTAQENEGKGVDVVETPASRGTEGRGTYDDEPVTISSNTRGIDNIYTSNQQVPITFTDATKISVNDSSKIKLYEKNTKGRTLIQTASTSVIRNTLYVNLPKNNESRNITLELEVESGAINLTNGNVSNTNKSVVKKTFTLKGVITDSGGSSGGGSSSSTKYQVVKLFDFTHPETLNPPVDISNATNTSQVSVGAGPYKTKDGNIWLTFDNSDAYVGGSGASGDIQRPLPGIYVLGGENTCLAMDLQVRAKFEAKNDCKIKAIHFINTTQVPTLWKTTNNGLNKYYHMYKEGYHNISNSNNQNSSQYINSPGNADYDGSNLTLINPIMNSVGKHDNYSTWYFNDGVDSVVFIHLSEGKLSDWRRVWVEYEESNTKVGPSDIITYYNEYTFDFTKLSATTRFTSLSSTDNCITVSNIASIYGEYPSIVAGTNSKNCLRSTQSKPFQITARPRNENCEFGTEILSVEFVGGSLISNLNVLENYSGSRSNPQTYDNYNLYNVGNNSTNYYNLSTGLQYKLAGFTGVQFGGDARIYGIKVKYRTTYSADEIKETTYVHPKQYSTNPSPGMDYDLIYNKHIYTFAESETYPLTGGTVFNNIEHTLNNIVLYGNINLYINPKLENVVWFYDLNEAGYSLDGTVTPVYTKKGKLIDSTYNGKSCVKIKWEDAVGMEVQFTDGLLSKWYSNTELFVIIIPLGLLCDTSTGNGGHGNSSGMRIYVPFSSNKAVEERTYIFDFELPYSLNPSFSFLSNNEEENITFEDNKTFTSDDGAVTLKFVAYTSSRLQTMYVLRLINGIWEHYLDIPAIAQIHIILNGEGELKNVSFPVPPEHLKKDKRWYYLGGLYMDYPYYGGDFNGALTLTWTSILHGVKEVVYNLVNHNTRLPRIQVTYTTNKPFVLSPYGNLYSGGESRETILPGESNDLEELQGTIKYPERIYVPTTITVQNCDKMKNFADINYTSGNHVVVDATHVPLFIWGFDHTDKFYPLSRLNDLWYYTGANYTFGINPDYKVTLHLTCLASKSSDEKSYDYNPVPKPVFKAFGHLENKVFNKDSNFPNVGGMHVVWETNLSDVITLAGLYIIDISPYAYGDNNFYKYIQGDNSVTPLDCYVLKDTSQFYKMGIDPNL